jgi:hypothetical protein
MIPITSNHNVAHGSEYYFILLQESWKTLKRTLMSAALARLPPNCRKHIIVGNDGHDVKVRSRSALGDVVLYVL